MIWGIGQSLLPLSMPLFFLASAHHLFYANGAGFTPIAIGLPFHGPMIRRRFELSVGTSS